MLSLGMRGCRCHGKTSGSNKPGFDCFSISVSKSRWNIHTLPHRCSNFILSNSLFKTNLLFQKSITKLQNDHLPFLPLLVWGKCYLNSFECFSYRHCCIHIPALTILINKSMFPWKGQINFPRDCNCNA